MMSVAKRKQKFYTIVALSSICLATSVVSPVWGALPQPDVILYGTVHINDTVATSGVTVVARVSGQDEPVAAYTYGECSETENGSPCPPNDRFLLRVQMESVSDDPNQLRGLGTVHLGEVIQLYVQEEGEEEKFAASVPVTDRGLVMELDLTPTAAGGPGSQLMDASTRWYADSPDALLPPGLLSLLEQFRQMTKR